MDKEADVEKGETYRITFKLLNSNKGETVILYYSLQNEGILLLDNSNVDGTLVVRTLTHRFDIETFIVVIVIILYFVLFFKGLYKLFS